MGKNVTEAEGIAKKVNGEAVILKNKLGYYSYKVYTSHLIVSNRLEYGSKQAVRNALKRVAFRCRIDIVKIKEVDQKDG